MQTRRSAAAEIARVGAVISHYSAQDHLRSLTVVPIESTRMRLSTTFQVIADYLSSLSFRQRRVPLFNTIVRGEPLN